MNLRLNESHEQLRSAVQAWARKSYTDERRREIAKSGGFDRDALRELAGLGVCGLYVPESCGGLALGPVEAMVIAEELGRGLVLEPIANILVSGWLLGTSAATVDCSTWLSALSSGDVLIVLAWQETCETWRSVHCDTQARRQNDGWKITGHKRFVPAGDCADCFLVPARVNDALAMFLVDSRAHGVTRTGYQTQDGSRAADVSLRAAPATLVVEQAGPVFDCALDHAIALACAEGVGLMEAVLALTIAYMKERKQFGVPLANFQVLRHYVADMKMHLELARSMSYYATLHLRSSPAERRRAAAQAKHQLGKSIRLVGQHAMQLHGGLGLTDQYTLSHFFRKLTQLQLNMGDAWHHLAYLSELIATEGGDCFCALMPASDATVAGRDP